MNDTQANLSQSALLYPQKFDVERDSAFFIAMTRQAYRQASFLDDRVLATGIEGRWMDFAEVVKSAQRVSQSRPLHFIFHTGHVGSTLLSRLLDQAPGVLGLREPLPLRTLAELQDVLGTPKSRFGTEQFEAHLKTFLNLWRRGFADTSHVVLKATSSSGRLATRALSASPASKAVYLNLRAEPYLATLLAGANAMVDLGGFGAERARRVSDHFGLSTPPLSSLSIGELAAMSWIAESWTRNETANLVGNRVMLLDFDSLLADLETTLGAVLAHFGIAVPANFLSSIGRSAVLTRYSKAPEQYAYSPMMRAQLLRLARQEHASELSKGLRYIEQLAKQDGRVAALL
jgi:hypothetical protein